MVLMKNFWDWIDCVFSIYIFLNLKELSLLFVVLEVLIFKLSYVVLFFCKVFIFNWFLLIGIIFLWIRGFVFKSLFELFKLIYLGLLGSFFFCGDFKLFKLVFELYKLMRFVELDDFFFGVFVKSGWNIFVLGVLDNFM